MIIGDSRARAACWLAFGVVGLVFVTAVYGPRPLLASSPTPTPYRTQAETKAPVETDVRKGSGSLGGVWTLIRDIKLDGVVDPVQILSVRFSAHQTRFVGAFVGIDNDSIFEGETYSARTTTIITFLQYDDTYYAIHSGREIAPGIYEGTWYDVGGGSGDFRLKLSGG